MMRKIGIWWMLLSKRLLKKPSFIVIICMLPIIVGILTVVSKQSSGMMTIALCAEKSSDPLPEKMVQELLHKEGIIQFLYEEDVDAAQELLEEREVDAVWVFPADMTMAMQKLAQGEYSPTPLVTVIEREDVVFLQIAREMLFAMIYPDYCYEIYRQYMYSQFGDEVEIDEEELRADYESMRIEGSLFEFGMMSEGQRAPEKTSYIIMPVRGLLALMVVLAGFASELYYMQDESRGSFDWMTTRKKWVLSYGYEMTSMSYIALAMFIALCVSGLVMNPLREIAMLVIYMLACAGSANLLRKCTKTVSMLGACIPFGMMLMLALCPVFYTVRMARPLQFLLAPFHYLNATYNDTFLIYLVIYALIAVGLDFTLEIVNNG